MEELGWPEELFPFLVVNMGSGVSVLRVRSLPVPAGNQRDWPLFVADTLPVPADNHRNKPFFVADTLPVPAGNQRDKPLFVADTCSLLSFNRTNSGDTAASC